MRFSNENYLKAFPRTEAAQGHAAINPAPAPAKQSEPDSVTDPEPEQVADPEQEAEAPAEDPGEVV